ncbi:MAG TPA: arginine deiminase family protein [Patescibacteria group bacterium]|nr:arginine deiminase family protein [Patescibacteria group bacterium]
MSAGRVITALVREPGPNFADGITTAALGKPDFKKAVEQHRKYCSTLQNWGVTITILPADPAFPDGCFVEDTAIVTENVTVITNPGAAARQGEQKRIAEILDRDGAAKYIRPPGTLDGGDVMEVEGRFYIGLSDRTNEDGARQLAAILEPAGYTAEIITLDSPVLHLKTGITYAGRNTVIGIENYLRHPAFARHEKITIPDNEAGAANCLHVNGNLLISAGFPATESLLRAAGFRPQTTPSSEFAKMDGALTCLSLLCHTPLTEAA